MNLPVTMPKNGKNFKPGSKVENDSCACGWVIAQSWPTCSGNPKLEFKHSPDNARVINSSTLRKKTIPQGKSSYPASCPNPCVVNAWSRYVVRTYIIIALMLRLNNAPHRIISIAGQRAKASKASSSSLQIHLCADGLQVTSLNVQSKTQSPVFISFPFHQQSPAQLPLGSISLWSAWRLSPVSFRSKAQINSKTFGAVANCPANSMKSGPCRRFRWVQPPEGLVIHPTQLG